MHRFVLLWGIIFTWKIVRYCGLWSHFDGLGCFWGTSGRQGVSREGSKMTFDWFLMDLGLPLEVLWGPFGPHVRVLFGYDFRSFFWTSPDTTVRRCCSVLAAILDPCSTLVEEQLKVSKLSSCCSGSSDLDAKNQQHPAKNSLDSELPLGKPTNLQKYWFCIICC